MSKLALLLDADFFAYQAAARVETSVDWGDDDGEGVVNISSLEEAKEAFISSIQPILTRNKEWSKAIHIMCFTDDRNWRKDILPTYKLARKAKPVVYWRLKQWVMENYQCFQRPGLEGDDCMGILSTRPSLIGADRAIIVSPDKDFKTIPGQFYWMTERELLTLTEEEADYWHMYQTLMGDSTDGYKGCPGMGPDSAKKFLAEPYMMVKTTRVLKSGPRKGQEIPEWIKRPLQEGETLWDAIVSRFTFGGKTEEDALVQARVARILRASDYDFKEKRPILWTPPVTKE